MGVLCLVIVLFRPLHITNFEADQFIALIYMWWNSSSYQHCGRGHIEACFIIRRKQHIHVITGLPAKSDSDVILCLQSLN